MTDKLVLTVCTANYLGQAKTMADSVVKYNSDCTVVIGLVDKLPADFDRAKYDPHTLIEVHELQIPEFEGMRHKYNALELSCALKTYFVNWLLERKDPSLVIYLDADILVYSSLKPVGKMLDTNSFLLSPHITTPFPDHNLRPREKDILKTGMFNAGFFAVKNDETGRRIIRWWKERMKDQAFERPKEGLNIDQNWLNFVPLYFPDTHVVRHPGCNVAYWNLHERNLMKQGDSIYVNGEPLIFFHFSGYSLAHGGELSRHQDRIKLTDNAVVAGLLTEYRDLLIQNKHEEMLKMPFYYKVKKGWFR